MLTVSVGGANLDQLNNVSYELTTIVFLVWAAFAIFFMVSLSILFL